MKHFSLVMLTLFCATLSYAKSHDVEPEDIMQLVKREKIDFIDCMFTDVGGCLRCVTIPAHQMQHALEYGLTFDGSSIPGCTRIHESDMVLRPDLNTFFVMPEKSCKTARIMCDMCRNLQTPYEADPRTILKRTLDHARELGFEFYVGPELEFFFFKENCDNLTPCDHARYFEAEECMDKDCMKKELMQELLDQGIVIEKLHHEVAPGQHEMSIHYDNALEIADQVILAKHIIKSYARKHHLKATFMPKPIQGQNGSGMHVHFSLFDTFENRNAFYDRNDPLLLSNKARHFIAGVLHHASELSALFNSAINSYKRLVPGHEAPIYRCWATKNRSAMIRIPQIDYDQACAARAEIRSPDACANPYLVFAGLLRAGLDGMAQESALCEPTETNLYRLSLKEIQERGITTLPTSLEQSLEIFEHSAFMRDVLGEAMIHEYLALKKEELMSFKKIITRWEIERYFS